MYEISSKYYYNKRISQCNASHPMVDSEAANCSSLRSVLATIVGQMKKARPIL